ncbi:hypothetical protein BDW22DRAFT_374171 [Trametopsis cervina]|nr:hypothetical protein BDW22DRAFT_374171 [Trametopsis cervina]
MPLPSDCPSPLDVHNSTSTAVTEAKEPCTFCTPHPNMIVAICSYLLLLAASASEGLQHDGDSDAHSDHSSGVTFASVDETAGTSTQNKPKVCTYRTKPCAYFSTLRGCLKGNKCNFQHVYNREALYNRPNVPTSTMNAHVDSQPHLGQTHGVDNGMRTINSQPNFRDNVHPANQDASRFYPHYGQQQLQFANMVYPHLPPWSYYPLPNYPYQPYLHPVVPTYIPPPPATYFPGPPPPPFQNYAPHPPHDYVVPPQDYAAHPPQNYAAAHPLQNYAAHPRQEGAMPAASDPTPTYAGDVGGGQDTGTATGYPERDDSSLAEAQSSSAEPAQPLSPHSV